MMPNFSKNCKFTKICMLPHPFWLQRMTSYHGHRTEVYQDLLNFKLAQNTTVCIWTAHFLVYYVTGTAVGACSRLHMDRVPWKACFGSNICFVDCTSIGFFRSVRSLFFPAISCCCHAGGSAQSAACPTFLYRQISSSFLPLTLAALRSEGTAVCQRLLWHTWVVTVWAQCWHAAGWRQGTGFHSQADRPNPFRHKEDIFRITNIQSVTDQTKCHVSENYCLGRKTRDIREIGFSALESHIKYVLNYSKKNRRKIMFAKPTGYIWASPPPHQENFRLELRCLSWKE